MSSKPLVIVVHGWEGKPDSNWFPWLARELKAQSISVLMPQFPPQKIVSEHEWTAVLDENSRKSSELYLVGHSLGVLTILKYLEQPRMPAVKGAVLVSGFARDIGIAEFADFFKEPVNFEMIRSHGTQFTVINSDNDPYVPLAEAEFLAMQLRTPLVIAHGKGHINHRNGITEYKPILDAILSMLE